LVASVRCFSKTNGRVDELKRVAILLALSVLTDCASNAAARAAHEATQEPITITYNFALPSESLTTLPRDGKTDPIHDISSGSNIGATLLKRGYAIPLYQQSYDGGHDYSTLAGISPKGRAAGWKCHNGFDEHEVKGYICQVVIGTMVPGEAEIADVMGQKIAKFACTPKANDIGQLLIEAGPNAKPGTFAGSNWIHDDSDLSNGAWQFGKKEVCGIRVAPNGSILTIT
jgi:hypothetical protein